MNVCSSPMLRSISRAGGRGGSGWLGPRFENSPCKSWSIVTESGQQKLRITTMSSSICFHDARCCGRRSDGDILRTSFIFRFHFGNFNTENLDIGLDEGEHSLASSRHTFITVCHTFTVTATVTLVTWPKSGMTPQCASLRRSSVLFQ
jgi:hypothetical protein